MIGRGAPPRAALVRVSSNTAQIEQHQTELPQIGIDICKERLPRVDGSKFHFDFDADDTRRERTRRPSRTYNSLPCVSALMKSTSSIPFVRSTLSSVSVDMSITLVVSKRLASGKESRKARFGLKIEVRPLSRAT